MSAQNRTENKSGKPAGLEDKALPQAEVEDKAVAVAPAADPKADDGKVKVVLTHFVSAGYIDGEEHGPGDEVLVSKQMAHNLYRAGAGKVAD